MEPERKIEKLLRAYAKKRRAAAGDAFKLHPATRRMLQAEVARNKPRPDRGEADISLWELLCGQWAFLAVFTLIIFFGASLFLPALSKAKLKSQQTTAMSNLKQIGVAAQMAAEENNGKLPVSLDALTNQLGSERMLTEAESGKRYIYIAGGENLNGLPSNSVLAYSSADQNKRAVLFADGRVEVVKRDRFVELTNRGLLQLAAANDSTRRESAGVPAEVAAAEPAISKQLKSGVDRAELKRSDAGAAVHGVNEPAASPSAIGTAGSNRQSVVQTNSAPFASGTFQNRNFSSQESLVNTAGLAGKPPVLVNFQVQQNGSAIRVVDADGSVYDGSVLSPSEVAQNAPSPAAALPTATGTLALEPAAGGARQDESQAAQNYFFRVSGTNRTLNQTVVFAGNFLAMSSRVTNAPLTLGGSAGLAGGGGGGQLQTPLAKQLSNLRVEGTAVIAGTNRIQISAEPVVP